MEFSMERGEGCSSLAGKSFGYPVPYIKLAEASFPDPPSLPALGEKGGFFPLHSPLSASQECPKSIPLQGPQSSSQGERHYWFMA